MSEASIALPRLLIADDSRMVRASIIKQVRDRFDCREASDGESAWQTLVVDPGIEVLITDIGMPHLDGYGLISRLRASQVNRLKKLPVVVISGDEDNEARERVRQLGANDFITKGIGSAELLARLDSLSRLGQASRELEQSREALARQSPVDPSSGLSTRSYLDWRASQDLALARRNQGGISVMVVEIDQFGEFTQSRGQSVANLVAKRLRAILASKVRHEDTVTELVPGQFAVLSPLADIVTTCAFALRLQAALEKLVLTYRDEPIRIAISAGVSSSFSDGTTTLDELIEVAITRLKAGQVAGGSRVIGNQGEVTREVIERMMQRVVSIDQMLARLRLGHQEELVQHLPEIVATLLPLLGCVESRLKLGIPMERLQEYALTEDAKGGRKQQ